ncbi:MAG: S1 family peptidase [Clostridiales bacterium]|nr:S1 family peptidase [Clostridiales bacterium]MCF8021549.1 S1 family peptidase [Clostridiales bacterium]
MDKFLKVLNRNKSRLLRYKNVRGVGVGYKQKDMQRTDIPSLVVFVEKKEKKDRLTSVDRVPLKINGVETDVVEIGNVRLLDTRKERIRPAQPGISIGHYKISAGTFGAVVKDAKTKELLILSNNHILANGTNGRDNKAKIGDPILQPGSYDGGTEQDKLASLQRFLPLYRGVQEPECPVAAGMERTGNNLIKMLRPNYEMKILKYTRQSNVVDAAVAKPVSPDIISEEILEIGKIESTAESEAGMSIQKSGRSSGLTKGNITAIGVSLKVDLGNEEYGWFSDQVVADIKVNPGDSGSLVLNENNDAVGLVFAGSDKHSIFNRIHNVLDKLEVTF